VTGEGAELGPGGETEHGEDIGLGDAQAAEADELVEGGLGIAHTAIGAAGDGVESGFADVDAFG
jgi:hypothetical protein